MRDNSVSPGNPVMITSELDDHGCLMGMHWVWCPGCEQVHPFRTLLPGSTPNERATWDWDGDETKPTFSPSLLVHDVIHLCEGEHEPVVCPNPETCGARGHMILGDDDDVRVLGHPSPHTRQPSHGNCHSFLTAGRWHFLGDSAHHLAGQTVDLTPLPDWFVGMRG